MKSEIIAKREPKKSKLIEALRKAAIVQLACQQAGVSRATYYRWRKENEKFALACDQAIAEGVSLVSDLAESKLITAIKEQNYSAIAFWLRHRHPAYNEKINIQAKVETTEKPLTPEQQAAIKRAIELASNSYGSTLNSLGPKLESGSNKQPDRDHDS